MYESEKLGLIMQQYRLYAEQKDNFIKRSFAVNRFYMCLVIILLLLINLTKNVVFVYSLSLPFLFSVINPPFNMECGFFLPAFPPPDPELFYLHGIY